MSVSRATRDVVALAHEADGLDALERGLLAVLARAVGFDVAFVQAKVARRAPTLVGLAPPAIAAIAARGAAYERELREVQRAALRRRGVAIDTDVLGEAAVRARAYHRDVAAPVGGASSLLAYGRVRGREVCGLMLGRSGAFRARDVATIEALLPAIALAVASFAPPAPPVVALASGALTPREREVLEYVCLGYTNAEIARACGSSPFTVRNQLARVFAKIGASTRAEAVALALRGDAPR